MKHVSIKTPCSEQWEHFTPTEKGGFCASCQKEVIDFSQKSNLEIQTILEQNTQQRLCGKFGVEQLQAFNEDYLYWKNQSPSSIQSRFVLALILVFGLGLFSCSNESQDSLRQLTQIKTSYITTSDLTQTENEQVSVVEAAQPITPTPPKTPPSFHQYEIMGDIDIGYSPSTDNNIEIEPPLEPTVTQPTDTNQTAPNCNTNTISLLGQRQQFIVGMVVNVPHPVQAIDSVPPPKKETTPEIVSTEIETKLFPNPTNDYAQLVVDLAVETNLSINLMSYTGQVLQSIHQGNAPEGRSNFDIDLTNLPKGIFLINIRTQTGYQTLKLVKN